MSRWVGIAYGWIAAAGAAMGQTSPSDVPPLGLPTVLEAPGLPNGAAVSRPLQTVSPTPAPVGSDPLAPAEITVLPGDVTRYEEITPLGRSWAVYEFLLWWPAAAPLPRSVSGGPLDSPVTPGGRFTLGSALDSGENVGYEVTYLFTGTQTRSGSLSSATVGTFDGSASNRMTGWEVTGVANLFARPDLRVNALAGYRYFMANEGLRLERYQWNPDSAVGAADQYDAHNRFHGGQLGLHTDWMRGPVFVELAGKVGIGQAVNVVRTSGQTVTVTPGFPFPGARTDQGGLFAQPWNSGRFVRSGFAVLPEATVKVGYRSGDRSRVYLGYNFLYLSEAARPGDQVQSCGCAASATGMTATTPTPAVVPSDFWVQGLLFGVEYRY